MRQPVDPEVHPEEALEYLVKLAIVERCRELGFPVPSMDNLELQAWESGASTRIATVKSTRPDMRAIVEIPVSGIEREGVRVVVSRPVDG